MIYWVYSCDYSLLEAPWSKLLALLDFIHISYGNKPRHITFQYLEQTLTPKTLVPGTFKGFWLFFVKMSIFTNLNLLKTFFMT